MTTNTHDYADKIAKLLATAESYAAQGNEATAAQYMARASQLQLQKQISDSDLRARQADAAPTDELITYVFKGVPKNAGYIKAKRDLVAYLTGIFNLRATMASDRSQMNVYGHTTDIEFVQALFNSLVIQMESSMERAARGQGRSFRTSFAHGFVSRVAARLREARAAQTSEAAAETPGTAIVLRDRATVVNDYYADVTAGRVRGTGYRNRSINSFEGTMAGDAAGRRADLGQPRVGARRAIN